MEHARATNKARQEAGPMSPAGTDPVELGKAEEEGDEGQSKRAGRRPSRNAAQSTPQETR